MPCESCAVQFSVFKRKRSCCECERYYCSSCLRRGGGSMCAPCRVLSTRPLSRQAIANFKVRDLQCFLQRQNVSTRGCVEKEELVSLCVSHVNSASFRRRGPRAGSSAFSSLKGITSNINEFISAHFDPRQAPQPEQRAWPVPPAHPPTSNCYNTTHTHSSPANNVPSADAPQAHQERFTITPGGEADIRVQVSESHASVSRSASTESALVDTADCYKVEDLDDSDWELVNKPADPLPNDSDVLLSAIEVSAMRRERAEQRVARSPEQAQAPRAPPAPAPRSPQRAASELELRQHESAADTDSASMSDEPLGAHSDGTPRRMSLGQFKSASQLELLNVKQLKELLMLNRVEYRGCLERADLLHRAQTLWRNHAESSHDSDNLPLEECCKICMAAPLECVLLECGHIAACTQCSKQLSECPFCRQYVVRAVRFFRS